MTTAPIHFASTQFPQSPQEGRCKIVFEVLKETLRKIGYNEKVVEITLNGFKETFKDFSNRRPKTTKVELYVADYNPYWHTRVPIKVLTYEENLQTNFIGVETIIHLVDHVSIENDKINENPVVIREFNIVTGEISLTPEYFEREQEEAVNHFLQEVYTADENSKVVVFPTRVEALLQNVYGNLSRKRVKDEGKGVSFAGPSLLSQAIARRLSSAQRSTAPEPESTLPAGKSSPVSSSKGRESAPFSSSSSFIAGDSSRTDEPQKSIGKDLFESESLSSSPAVTLPSAPPRTSNALDLFSLSSAVSTLMSSSNSSQASSTATSASASPSANSPAAFSPATRNLNDNLSGRLRQTDRARDSNVSPTNTSASASPSANSPDAFSPATRDLNDNLSGRLRQIDRARDSNVSPTNTSASPSPSNSLASSPRISSGPIHLVRERVSPIDTPFTNSPTTSSPLNPSPSTTQLAPSISDSRQRSFSTAPINIQMQVPQRSSTRLESSSAEPSTLSRNRGGAHVTHDSKTASHLQGTARQVTSNTVTLGNSQKKQDKCQV